jgi:hypothetical protein
MLGFGFNKNKVLANAERSVQQGKLQNAITEYEKIIKADPKDLTVRTPSAISTPAWDKWTRQPTTSSGSATVIRRMASR